jgi:hypothetical protein
MTAAFRAVREALRDRALPPRPRPEVEAARALTALAPGVVAGVVFFGSQRTKAGPDRFSAYDFFVVVEAYRPFYRALHAASRVRRRPGLLAAVNAVLTPSQISLRLPDGRGGELHAKCSIITLDHLRRETSGRRRDHFTIGRLFQPAEILAGRDEAARGALLDALAGAAAATYSWARPFLPPSFDTGAYLRTLLRTSLGREVRPEPSERRAEELHEAQREEQIPVYRRLLEGLVADGELEAAFKPGEAEPAFALVRPVGLAERLSVEIYFRVSTTRATLRWLKHMLTFEGWFEYIQRKAERHTGEKIELTEKERRHPAIFIWPRFIRYLRHKDEGGGKGPRP